MQMRKRRRYGLLLTLLIAILLLALLGGFWSWRSLQDYHAFKGHLDALQNLATGDLAHIDLEVVAQNVVGLRSEMMALHRDAKPFLWLAPYLGWVPRFGTDIQSAPDLMTLGLNLTQAGELIVDAFSPVFEAGMDSPQLRQLATSSLMVAQPHLVQAQTLIAEAAQARSKVDVAKLSDQLQGYLIKLDRYLPIAQFGLDASHLAVKLLGLDTPKAYLVVAQNNDELRATGGFITAAGRVVLHEGEITEMSFMDSYAVDDLSRYYPDPPQALYDTMLAEQWLFRDSNWSPDFPTAAQQMASFFEFGTGQPVDGVVALDLNAIRFLVDAIGPIMLEGEEIPFTGLQVVEWMRAARGGLEEGEGLGEWWAKRKDFMSPLAEAIKQRLESAHIDWLGLIKAVQQTLNEKHLLFYFEDPETQAFLHSQNLDGGLIPTTGDYWMVVDSNVGFNKADASIERQVFYQIDMSQDGSLVAKLDLYYRNRTPASEESCDPTPRYSESYQLEYERCYWDYARVYVPQTAELIQAPYAPLPEPSLSLQKLGRGGEETFQILGAESGKQAFGFYFLLPKGEDRLWSFSYHLPSGILRKEDGRWYYQLVIQKQPGKNSEQVQVRLHMPGLVEIIRVEPQPEAVLVDEVRFALDLESDLTLQIEFRVVE
jgi:hypothetical protein